MKMPDTAGKGKLFLALPVAIVVGILNVFLFFLFMVLYGHVINPGHEDSFYQEAANRFGPISSIICGIPLMYLAGRWIGKRVGPQLAIKAALLVWLIYFIVDVAIVAAAGFLIGLYPVAVVAISFTTKLIAVYLGGRSAQRSL